MPKKTKREKIIAEYRRKLMSVSASPEAQKPTKESVSARPSPDFIPQFSIPSPQSKNNDSSTAILDPQEFLAIKKDLTLTLGLTACILIGQIVLWRVVG